MPPKFHYVLAVWGEAFTDFFLRYVLPTHMSARNLPSLTSNARSSYDIYTTSRNAEAMQASEAIARLRNILEVRFFVMTKEDEALLASENVYDVLGAFHRHAIRRAVREDAFIVFLAPDAVFSDGSLASMERRAYEGCDCLLIPSICTVKEEVQPWLDLVVGRGGPAALSADDLVLCALRHMHPIVRSMFWGSERFNATWSSQFFWHAGPTQLLAHYWHLHPLMVRPHSKSFAFASTVDGDFVEVAASGTRTCIVQDSDELCVIEMSPRNRRDSSLQDLRPFDRKSFLAWAASWVKPVHTKLVRVPILFHAGPIDQTALEPVRAEAAAVIESLAAEVEATMPQLPPVQRIETLQAAQRVFIYGSGRAGQAVRELLCREGVPVTAFLDSRREGEAHGLPLIAVDRYAGMQESGDVVIVVSQYWREIEDRIRQLGILNCFDGYFLFTSQYAFTSQYSEKPLDFSIESWHSR